MTTNQIGMIRSVLQISSGTMGTLTGETNYDKIDSIQNDVVQFLLTSNKVYANWMQVWNDYKSTLDLTAS